MSVVTTSILSALGGAIFAIFVLGTKRIKGLTEEEVEDITYANACRFFNLQVCGIQQHQKEVTQSLLSRMNLVQPFRTPAAPALGLTRSSAAS